MLRNKNKEIHSVGVICLRYLGFTGILLVTFTIHAQVLLTDHAADDRYPRWSPDGQRIAFESNRNGNWDIFVMSVEGAPVTQVTDQTSNERFPTWHPSGNRLLFSSDRSGTLELYEVDLESVETEKLVWIDLKGDVLFPEYSTSGQQIVFSHSFNLWLADMQGSAVTQLTHDTKRSLYPVWSPVAEQLAFFSRRDTQGKTDELYTYDVPSGTINRLTNWPTHNFAPSWSPNADFLVCATSMEGARPELFLVRVGDGQLLRLTSNDYGDTEPDWSPQGNTVVYACQQAGNYDICLLSLDDYLRDYQD